MTNKVAAQLMGTIAVSMFVQFVVMLVTSTFSTNEYGERSKDTNFNHTAWPFLGSSIAFAMLTRHFSKLPPGEKANWKLCQRK
jgi:choline-glycine betaine transporter